MSTKASRRWLFHQAKSAWVWIALSIGLGLCSGLLLIVQASYISRIIHAVAIDGLRRSDLFPFWALLIAVIVARSLLAWGREVAGFRAGAGIRREVRATLLAHIVELGPAYTARQKTGELSSAAMEQVEGLQGFFAHYLPQLALAGFIPLTICVFIFPLSWAAGGLLLITAPLIPLFMVLIGMGAESISQRHFQALSRMSAHFLDTLQGLPTLKLFGRSRSETATIAHVSNAYRLQTMKVLRVAFLSSAVLEFFTSIAIALVAVYLGMTYLGYYTFGTWGEPLTLAGGFFILLLAPDFYLPLRELGTHYHVRAEAMGAAGEILKILSVPAPVAPVKREISQVGLAQKIHIRCENLHLSFDKGRRQALRGVSLDLHPGERLALVGESGAGKTSIINVLLGFTAPDSGTVLVNGNPMADLPLETWRTYLSWIGQDPVLFFGSIRENIQLGRAQATDAEIEEAARRAGVTDFTDDLPHKLDTSVGERGVGLSRGQVQRVALARAFLKDAPILFLDEPTASLDLESEKLVMQALEKLTAGRTVLILTHRLAGIEKTDRICVLSGGRIVEQGRYQELACAGGAFQHLLERSLPEKQMQGDHHF